MGFKALYCFFGGWIFYTVCFKPLFVHIHKPTTKFRMKTRTETKFLVTWWHTCLPEEDLWFGRLRKQQRRLKNQAHGGTDINYAEDQAALTQNALSSKWKAVEGERVGVVSSRDGESVILAGELQAPGNGPVKSNGLVERQVGVTLVVGLVDSPAWSNRGHKMKVEQILGQNTVFLCSEVTLHKQVYFNETQQAWSWFKSER